MKTKVVIIGLTSFCTLLGCGKKMTQSSDSANALSTSIESGITTLDGIVDDQSGSSFALNAKPGLNMYAARLLAEVIPQAHAANCIRAVFEPCNNGARSTNFDNCELPFSQAALNGSVTLSYSDASCALPVGASVTRTYDFTLSSTNGGELNVSSADHYDYLGDLLGGGGSLLRTGVSSWDLSIAGKRKVFTRNGSTRFDVSVRTVTPVTVSGSLSRSGRTMDGGAYEVNHNLAKFTAVYQPHNLAWVGTCCHPVSGTLDVTYSGSVTGTGSVTFNGCGSATLTKDGLSQDISINYCE